MISRPSAKLRAIFVAWFLFASTGAEISHAPAIAVDHTFTHSGLYQQQLSDFEYATYHDDASTLDGELVLFGVELPVSDPPDPSSIGPPKTRVFPSDDICTVHHYRLEALNQCFCLPQAISLREYLTSYHLDTVALQLRSGVQFDFCNRCSLSF